MIDKKVCVVGVGYVGLPLAEAFARYELQLYHTDKGISP
jgi:UDP-N-acetyl-D-mannosaminuronate dehydrogenase